MLTVRLRLRAFFVDFLRHFFGGNVDITVNGTADTVAEGVTLLQYLEARGLDALAVVVERNGVIVASDSFAGTVLTDADTLEILHFVGGG